MEDAATDSSDLWSAMQGTTEMSIPVDIPTVSVTGHSSHIASLPPHVTMMEVTQDIENASSVSLGTAHSSGILSLPSPGTTTKANDHDYRGQISCVSHEYDVITDLDKRKQQDLKTLATLAADRGFIVKHTLGGGNCLFASIGFGLSSLGIICTYQELRRDVTVYLQNNLYSSDGSVHLKEYVSSPVLNPDAYTADTEQPSQIDLDIAQIQDPGERANRRWEQYLAGLAGSAWGEHIAVQGLANMLQVNIDIICSSNARDDPVTHIVCSSLPVGTVTIGLVGQFHYVALQADDTTPRPALPSTPEGKSDDDAEADTSDSDKEETEAFDWQVQSKGLPYESGLYGEQLHTNPETVYSIAPAEYKRPIPILRDPYFEEMCNPDKYPYGTGGVTTKREATPTIRKYFNQRLLDVDGRFARDVEYLLAAQYAVESKQVYDQVYVALRQTQGRWFRGEPYTAGRIKNRQVVQQMVRTNEAYCFLKDIRGTPPYFQRVMYDVLAMIRQLGLPTWFITLSAADMQWPDLLQTIARQYGNELSEEQIRAMSFDDRSKLLRQNPVTAARHFQYRLNALFNLFLKSPAHPLGDLVDYAVRIEFQARGSSHAHAILWIKDAPRINEQSDSDVCASIDRYVKCTILEDPEVAEFVRKSQTHRHSFTFRKDGKCRFHSPRPPSPHTLIAREQAAQHYSNQDVTDAQLALRIIHNLINSKVQLEGTSLEDLLTTAGVSIATYTRALQFCSSGNSVVLGRKPSECWVNGYNPDVLSVWRANMDIQYILDPYACVMYVASYMMKSEKSMGDLLKQVSNESSGQEIQDQLRLLGSVFLTHREVSAQEAVYRILSLPLKHLSRKVVNINTDPKPERVVILKKQTVLEGLNDTEEHIFGTSLIDRYAARPTDLNTMCLAEFAANYTTRNGEDTSEEGGDVIPEHDVQSTSTSSRIQLTSGLGYMYKRKREAVIRFHKIKIATGPTKVYRSNLMLYVPWRDEEIDILGGYISFRERYYALANMVLANEKRYSQNADLIDGAIDELTEHGPPQHAWDLLAPATEEFERSDQTAGFVVLQTLEHQDVVASVEMFQQEPYVPLLQRFTREAGRQLLSPDEYRRKVRQLNPKQREMVTFNRHWCKNAVTSLRENRPLLPYQVFLSGPGGVGRAM